MKIKLLLITLLIIIIIVITGITLYINTFGNYGYVIKMNWNINLPNSDKLIYYIDSGTSFNGDGEKYSILKYNNKSKLEKIENINWISQKNTDIEGKITRILENLKINDKYEVDFNKEYVYYNLKKKDNSEIFILYIKDEQQLYIVEDIF